MMQISSTCSTGRSRRAPSGGFTYLAWTAALVLVVAGCAERSEFDRLVESELASGEIHNELFLGYELGMAREAFYDYSWDLNRQGLVMQGPKNHTVEYDLDDELPYRAKMNYYPDFHDNKVFQMRVLFHYTGWAPWNKDLSSDSLLVDVVDLFREWYGDGFIQREIPANDFENGIQYAKVDGNRRILVAKHSDSEVVAVFTDLLAEKELESQDDGDEERVRELGG